ENVVLAPYTTFKIGGPAFFFLEVQNETEILEGINWAKAKYYPYCVLGGGSNVLISDSGFRGLVIKNEISFIKEPAGNIIEAGAGVFFGNVIMAAVNAGLGGLEWGIGIPGTLGGAIYGNAGAFGHSIREAVKEARVLEENGRIKIYKNKDCRFGYRESVFKRQNSIILSARLEFSRQSPEILRQSMREFAKNRPPSPPFPSAGCAFKNIEFKNLPAEAQKMIPPDKVKGGKTPAGFLIQSVGLAGKRAGGAKIWEVHCNYIINADNASAKDAMELIRACKKLVYDKFGVLLEEEIRQIGF
ncbi:MAG: UDP-N-acetylmuramate dehydrogenase, partial [bacterium]|nr:UDP-N-acetylmuramate dehydrogenase [bacterium]